MKSAKPATVVKRVTPTNPDSALRILKTGTCPSLSGKSKLTYQIGREGSSDIQFRVTANSSSGFFSQDWVSLSEIQEELDKVPSGKSITSFSMVPLYRGKSMNSPGFLFAALKQEGLVQGSKDKQRCYERGDLKGFMAGIKALIAVDGKPEGKPQSAKGEGTKKATAAIKKTLSKPSLKKKG